MNEFEISFWSSLASSAIIAIVFGTIIYILITRWINKSERKEQSLQERRLQIQRAIELVTILKEHAEQFKPGLENWTSIIDQSGDDGDYVTPFITGDIPRFDLTFWEMFKNSGELTKHLSPKMINELSTYFGYLVDARKIMDWIFEYWDDKNLSAKKSKRVKIYAQLISKKLLLAMKEFPHLYQLIEQELSGLRKILPPQS